jgi:hypothetical protein
VYVHIIIVYFLVGLCNAVMNLHNKKLYRLTIKHTGNEAQHNDVCHLKRLIKIRSNVTIQLFF